MRSATLRARVGILLSRCRAIGTTPAGRKTADRNTCPTARRVADRPRNAPSGWNRNGSVGLPAKVEARLRARTLACRTANWAVAATACCRRALRHGPRSRRETRRSRTRRPARSPFVFDPATVHRQAGLWSAADWPSCRSCRRPLAAALRPPPLRRTAPLGHAWASDFSRMSIPRACIFSRANSPRVGGSSGRMRSPRCSQRHSHVLPRHVGVKTGSFLSAGRRFPRRPRRRLNRRRLRPRTAVAFRRSGSGSTWAFSNRPITWLRSTRASPIVFNGQPWAAMPGMMSSLTALPDRQPKV